LTSPPPPEHSTLSLHDALPIYGISIVHYYWIGAVPAMVFLGIVMMPFYYGSRVRSVPEYLLRRYDRKTHLVNAIIFVLSSVLIADRKSTRLNSSHVSISYAVFC